VLALSPGVARRVFPVWAEVVRQARFVADDRDRGGGCLTLVVRVELPGRTVAGAGARLFLSR